MDASDHARALAAMRRLVERQCEVCGVVRRGLASRRYCGRSCRERARRERLRLRRLPLGDLLAYKLPLEQRCIVQLGDGRRCWRVATVYDEALGGMVCMDHAPDPPWPEVGRRVTVEGNLVATWEQCAVEYVLQLRGYAGGNENFIEYLARKLGALVAAHPLWYIDGTVGREVEEYQFGRVRITIERLVEPEPFET